MRNYSIPEKIVAMVKVMYSQSECAVIDESGVHDWFEIKTGVKQGCCMSGFLFLLVVDWVMRKTTKHGNTGIRWKFNNFLEELLRAPIFIVKLQSIKKGKNHSHCQQLYCTVCYNLHVTYKSKIYTVTLAY